MIVELGGINVEPERGLSSQAAIAAQRSRVASERTALRNALRGLGHRVLREFKTIPYVGLEVDHDALRLLDALPGLVTRVYESRAYEPTLAQSTFVIKAPDAWDAGWDGSGQVIAILDTGVDKSHPFLAGKVVSEACYDSSPFSNCPNGLSADTSSGAGVHCGFAPQCFHGTYIAGIAAGNGPSFDGIARGANLVAIRVFSLNFCGGSPCALAWDIDIAFGLERVLELSDTLPIAAANLSLGGDVFLDPCDSYNPMVTTAVANLRAANIAPVIASGNNGFTDAVSFPACISSAVSVGATTDGSGGRAADMIWDDFAFGIPQGSNAAYFLSLLAPGYLINSSVPDGTFVNNRGTSAAAAHVAGAWALAKQASPTASVDNILAGLRNTGKPVFDPGNGFTFPRIAATLLQFSSGTYNVAETAGTATITVTRDGSMFGPHFAPLTINYATSANGAVPGQDYVEASGTLEFNEGEVSKTFTVQILNDSKVDGQRKVALALSNPGGGALLGARDTADLNIGDNDVGGTIQLSASAYSVNENGTTAAITVTRTGGSASDVTVQYTTSNGTAQAGTDYETATGTITFDPSGPGATTKTFTVTILNNGLPDGNRTVNLQIHTPTGGAVLGTRKTAVLTIVNDDIALQFSQANYSVNEGGGSVTITVTRSGPTALPVGVSYTVLPGSATPGADYSGTYTGELLFPANQTSKTFPVNILNDTLAEGPETFLLQLSSPTGGAILGFRSTAVVTIVDNDAGGAFKFGASNYNASEGSAFANVTVTRNNGSASNGKVRIRTVSGGTAVAGTDYEALDRILDFGSLTSMNVPITLLTGSNLAVDGARTIMLALDQPEPNGLASVVSPVATTVTIVDNDVAGTVQFSPASISVLETAGNAVLTVTRTNGAAMGAGATWEITGVGTAIHGTDYDGPMTGSVSFDSGPSQPITIPLIDRFGAHGTRTLQVKLTAGTGGAKVGTATTATVNILDETVGFRLDKAAYPANEGTGSVTITVLRTGPSQGAAQVSVGTVDTNPGAGTAVPATDYTPVLQLLNFMPGQISKTVTVTLKNDTALDGPRTVNLALSGPSGGVLGEPHEATITVDDNDLAGTFRFTSGTFTATEGISGNVVVNIGVTRGGGSGGIVDVPWSITGGTATHDDEPGTGADVIVRASGTLQFGPNETNKTIQATIVPDSEVEPNETLTLELGTPSPSGALGTPSAATLVIVDSDRKGTIQFSAPVVNVAEANVIATIAVTRTGNLTEPASVKWAISGGSATRGDAPGVDVDYVAPANGTLNFAANQATPIVPLTIAVSADTIADGTETVALALDTPSTGWTLGTVASTTLSLVEGTVQLAGLPLTVSEGGGNKTITVTRGGLTTLPVTVRLTANSPGSAKAAASPNVCLAGDDYRPVNATQTFNPGQPAVTFSVPLCGDTLVEGDENLTVTLSVESGPAIIGPSGDTALLTITENDLAGVIRFSSASFSASESQGNATLMVNRTSSGAGVTVHWAIDVDGSTAVHGVDYTGPLEGDIDFGTLTSKSLVVPLVNTVAADGPRTIAVDLSTPLPVGLASLGSPIRAVLTIGDNEPTVRLNSATYAVGEASATFNVTVLRSGPTTSAVSVDLVPQATSAATGGTCGVGNADFSTSVIHVDIPAGQVSKTVPVEICSDARAELPETFTLALESPVGATLASPATATVTLTDNETGGTLQWVVANVSGVEGTTLVLTVTRTGGTASDVTVEVQAHDGDADTPGADAVAGVDYKVITATPLAFGDGILSQTVEISLLPGTTPRVHGASASSSRTRMAAPRSGPCPARRSGSWTHPSLDGAGPPS